VLRDEPKSHCAPTHHGHDRGFHGRGLPPHAPNAPCAPASSPPSCSPCAERRGSRRCAADRTGGLPPSRAVRSQASNAFCALASSPPSRSPRAGRRCATMIAPRIAASRCHRAVQPHRLRPTRIALPASPPPSRSTLAGRRCFTMIAPRIAGGGLRPSHAAVPPQPSNAPCAPAALPQSASARGSGAAGTNAGGFPRLVPTRYRRLQRSPHSPARSCPTRLALRLRLRRPAARKKGGAARPAGSHRRSPWVFYARARPMHTVSRSAVAGCDRPRSPSAAVERASRSVFASAVPHGTRGSRCASAPQMFCRAPRALCAPGHTLNGLAPT
jgi:hypothetical protein